MTRPARLTVATLATRTPRPTVATIVPRTSRPTIVVQTVSTIWGPQYADTSLEQALTEVCK